MKNSRLGSKSVNAATTVLELLLALAILLVCLSTGITLATSALEAAARVRRQEAASAAARVSLVELKNDLEAADAWTQSATNKLEATLDGVRTLWQVDTAAGRTALRRGTSAQLAGGTPQNYIAADNVVALSATQNGTLALTFQSGKRLDKFEATLKQWGQTLP